VNPLRFTHDIIASKRVKIQARHDESADSDELHEIPNQTEYLFLCSSYACHDHTSIKKLLELLHLNSHFITKIPKLQYFVLWILI